MKNLKAVGIIVLLIAVIGGVVWYFGDKQRTMNVAEKINLAGMQARIFNKVTYKIGEIKEATKKPKELMIFNSMEEAVKDGEELVKVFKDDDSVADSEKIDTSNWKTYRNDHYGYVISHPEDWTMFVKDYSDHKDSSRPIDLYITKECTGRKRGCKNEVSVSTFIPTMTPPENKAKYGKLNVSVADAFRNIFTLKNGETRDNLRYNTETPCFIYEQSVHCSYNYVNDAVYYPENITYGIEITDTSQNWKYLKTEKMIVDSLRVIRKIK